jgi:hypothetical protein
VRGAWGVGRGAWCVVRGAWRVVRGAWCVVQAYRSSIIERMGLCMNEIEACSRLLLQQGATEGWRKVEDTTTVDNGTAYCVAKIKARSPQPRIYITLDS